MRTIIAMLLMVPLVASGEVLFQECSYGRDDALCAVTYRVPANTWETVRVSVEPFGDLAEVVSSSTATGGVVIQQGGFARGDTLEVHIINTHRAQRSGVAIFRIRPAF